MIYDKGKMMNLLKKYILILIVSVVSISFSGCAKDDNSNNPADDKPACVTPVNELTGHWSGTSEITYDGCDMTAITANKDMYGISYSIQNKIGKKILTINAQEVATYTEEVYKVKVTYLTDYMVDMANGFKLCEIDDWKVNEERIITYCPGEDVVGVTRKKIYYLNGDNLTFGDILQIGVDGYPDVLDTNDIWIKQ